MVERRHYVLLGVFGLWLCGTVLTKAAPRHKRQSPQFMSWFMRQFPWYARQMAQNPSTSNQGPLLTYREPLRTNGPPGSSNFDSPLGSNSRSNQQPPLNSQWSSPYRPNFRQPVNPPVQAYNMPGVSVRGPLLRQRIGQMAPSFNNRGPLLGTAPFDNRVVPPADPQDPPDMVNGIPVTEAPEPTEPPEPTDPPDVTDPPEYPMVVATPAPTTTMPPPTTESLLLPPSSATPVVEQATPLPNAPNGLVSPFRAPTTPIPTEPVTESQGPVFQQAPAYLVTLPATAPPLATTPRAIYQQSAPNAVKQTTAASPLQITNMTPKPSPPLTAAPTTGNRPSSWVMGANFNNMSPWRRMLWNRYILNSMR